MIDAVKFNQQIEELERLLQDNLGLRNRGLSRQLKKAGRRLPGRVQKAGKVITGVEALMVNPRLARIQDKTAVDAAFAELTSYLKTLDRKDKRKGFALGIAGDLVIRLALLGGVVFAVLRWQGVI